MRRIFAVAALSLTTLLVPAAPASAHSLTCESGRGEAAIAGQKWVQELNKSAYRTPFTYQYQEVGDCKPGRKTRSGHRHSATYTLKVAQRNGCAPRGTPDVLSSYPIRVVLGSGRLPTAQVLGPDGKPAVAPKPQQLTTPDVCGRATAPSPVR